MENRYCTYCKTEKPIEDFYVTASGKIYRWCKSCFAAHRDARPVCPRCNFGRVNAGEELCHPCMRQIRSQAGQLTSLEVGDGYGYGRSR